MASYHKEISQIFDIEEAFRNRVIRKDELVKQLECEMPKDLSRLNQDALGNLIFLGIELTPNLSLSSFLTEQGNNLLHLAAISKRHVFFEKLMVCLGWIFFTYPFARYFGR